MTTIVKLGLHYRPEATQSNLSSVERGQVLSDAARRRASAAKAPQVPSADPLANSQVTVNKAKGVALSARRAHHAVQRRAKEQQIRSRIEATSQKGADQIKPAAGIVGGGLGPAQAGKFQERLMGSPGWRELEEAHRTNLTERLESTGLKGAATNMQLRALVFSPRWKSADGAHQAEALRRVSNLELPDGPADMKAAPVPKKEEALSKLQGVDALSELERDDRVRLQSRAVQDGPRGETARRLIVGVVDSPHFALQDRKGQAESLRGLIDSADNPASITPPQVQAQLEQSEGWEAMSSKEQASLRSRLADPMEHRVVDEVRKTLELGEFQRASAEKQADVLMRIEAGPSAPAAPSEGSLRAQLRDSGALSHLAPDERDALEERLGATGEAGAALRERLQGALGSPRFALRSAQERAQSLRGYLGDTEGWPTSGGRPSSARHSPSPDPLPEDVLSKVRASPGYRGLNESEKEQFNTLLSQERNPLSREARRHIEPLLYAIEPDPPPLQARQLREFLKTGPHVPGKAASIDLYQEPIHRVTMKGAQEISDYEFYDAQEDAILHQVQIGARSIQIIEPKDRSSLPEDAQHLPTVQEIADGLSRVPSGALETVTTVLLNPVRSPSDTHWSKEMERPGFRAAATADRRNGVMAYYPLPNRYDPQSHGDRARHEAGHLDSFQNVYGNERNFVQRLLGFSADGPSWSQWRGAVAADGNLVSHYGAENQDESFAEAYTLYTGTQGTPLHDEYRRIFPNRFRILDEFAT